MSNCPFLSIILPTYNVEQYLRQCLDSVKTQTYQNFEVIIVIDGATDGSYEIAKEYCKEDKRFTVYWQNNAGSGPARNNGLRHAKGELVMFIDPDDWIDNDYLEKMVYEQRKGNFDFVSAGGKAYKIDSCNNIVNVTIQKLPEQNICGQNEVRKKYAELLITNRLGGPHRKVYKRSIIENNNVEFPNYRRSQDIVFNYRYYNCINSVHIADYYGYNYRVGTNQYPKLSENYVETIKLMYSDVKDLHAKWGVEAQSAYASFFLFYVMSYISWCNNNSVNYYLIMKDTTIQEIIKVAEPKKTYIQIAQMLMKSKQYQILNIYLKMISKLKKIVK